MSKRPLTKQEKKAVIKQWLEESDVDIKAHKDDVGELSILKRERLYFLLALVFGLIFNLSASAIDNLIQMYSAHHHPDSFYFTYASGVIALSLAMIVWMWGKIHDFNNYIALAKDNESPQAKKSSGKNGR